MDSQRFDNLVRRFATGITRRAALAGVGAVAVSVRTTRAATAFQCDAACAAMGNPGDATTCDPDACFAAGGCCDPVFGCCAPDKHPESCCGPVIGCSASWVDPPCELCFDATDPRICVRHCCACPAEQTLCSPYCADLLTNGANCGACGHACATGQRCVGGACVADPCSACGRHERCKNGRCVRKRRRHHRHGPSTVQSSRQ